MPDMPASKADDEVLYEVADHVATITLNAPQRMNTLGNAMMTLLPAYLVEADADPDVRAIILTATGRAFCAGLDLRPSPPPPPMLPASHAEAATRPGSICATCRRPSWRPWIHR